jgi:hypothetical protein
MSMMIFWKLGYFRSGFVQLLFIFGNVNGPWVEDIFTRVGESVGDPTVTPPTAEYVTVKPFGLFC